MFLERLFSERSKDSKLVRLPNDSGIGPSNWLPAKDRYDRFLRPPLIVGISQDNWFLDKSLYIKTFKFRIFKEENHLINLTTSLSVRCALDSTWMMVYQKWTRWNLSRVLLEISNWPSIMGYVQRANFLLHDRLFNPFKWQISLGMVPLKLLFWRSVASSCFNLATVVRIKSLLARSKPSSHLNFQFLEECRPWVCNRVRKVVEEKQRNFLLRMEGRHLMD